MVAVSDWIRAVPDQIARWVPAPFTSLGTDGYGFSDTRAAARRFFHVDAESVTLAVLSQLARTGEVKHEVLAQAIEKYRLDLPVSAALAAREVYLRESSRTGTGQRGPWCTKPGKTRGSPARRARAGLPVYLWTAPARRVDEAAGPTADFRCRPRT